MVIQRVIEERGGDEAAHGGDQRRRAPLSPLRRDEPAVEDALHGTRRGRRPPGGIVVDVDVEEGLVLLEEAVPQRGEMEVGVGEEEEGDLGLVVGADGEAGDCAAVAALVGEGGEGGARLNLRSSESHPPLLIRSARLQQGDS